MEALVVQGLKTDTFHSSRTLTCIDVLKETFHLVIGTIKMLTGTGTLRAVHLNSGTQGEVLLCAICFHHRSWGVSHKPTSAIKLVLWRLHFKSAF